MKKLTFAAMAVAGVFASASAMAQDTANLNTADGTVEIRGRVVDQTCEVNTNYKNLVVILDTVAASKLDAKAKTASPKPFQIKIENCKSAQASGLTHVFASFSPATADLVDDDNAGTLKNRVATEGDYTAAGNVNIQLLNNDDSPINLGVVNGASGKEHSLADQGNKFEYTDADVFVTKGKLINENNHASTILGKKVVGGESVFGDAAAATLGAELTDATDYTLEYKAQYYATDAATPGLVEAYVNYNISYR